MHHTFQSNHSKLLGFPEPTEKWSEADLWKWENAGRPGNPPWNPTGKTMPNPQAAQAEIDASGNRDMYELWIRGQEGSFKAKSYQERESYYLDSKRIQDATKRKNLFKIAAVVGGVLLLVGMGS